MHFWISFLNKLLIKALLSYFRAAKHDLGYGAASAKKKRIIEFTPHHAKAAVTACEAALEMEQESKHDMSQMQVLVDVFQNWWCSHF